LNRLGDGGDVLSGVIWHRLLCGVTFRQRFGECGKPIRDGNNWLYR